MKVKLKVNDAWLVKNAKMKAGTVWKVKYMLFDPKEDAQARFVVYNPNSYTGTTCLKRSEIDIVHN